MAGPVLNLGLSILCMTSVGVCTAAAERKSIGVFIDFDSVPAPMAVTAMKREVGTIMKPTGFRVDWRKLKENRGTESFDGLVVVRFKGKCHVQPWPEDPAGEKLILGSTLVSDGQPLPFTEINCEQVRKTLTYCATDCDQERQWALGRALGRVVAHELYHALARTTAHAGKGLARATQSLRDLVIGRPIPFHPDDSDAIRRGISTPLGTLSFTPHSH